MKYAIIEYQCLGFDDTFEDITIKSSGISKEEAEEKLIVYEKREKINRKRRKGEYSDYTKKVEDNKTFWFYQIVIDKSREEMA